MNLKNKNSHFSNALDSRNGFNNRLNGRSGYFNHNYTRDEVKYVSERYPCRICGKPDWCAYTINVFGEMVLALCQRVSNGSIKQAKDNSYIHVLEEKPRIKTVVKKSPKISNPKADISRCNAVYKALLERTQVCNEDIEEKEFSALYSYHANQFLERGLGDDTIARNLYASVPDKDTASKLVQRLSKDFDLTGIPGFYKDPSGQWQLNTYHKGFYVPFRNHKGLIFGLQIRLDKPVNGKRYVWLSSPNNEGGASSGSPLHFVNVNLIQKTGEIYITEGALKADVIAELHKVGVVAIAGVKTVNAEILTTALKILFPQLVSVYLAFDMDFQTNENVQKALLNMEMEFQKWKGLEVKTLVWDLKDGKGFDDYLLQVGEDENE